MKPETLVLAAVLAVAVLAGCQPVASEPAHLRVTVVGDSLTHDITGQLVSGATARKFDLTVESFPGLALCGMFDAIKAEAAKAPDVLVIESAGNINAYTPCAFIDGKVPSGQPYLDLYEADLAAAVSDARSVSPGTRVLVVGVPPLIPADRADSAGMVADGPGTEWASDRLNEIYRRDAAPLGYAFADAGSSVAAGGLWTDTLPCLAGEPCVGHAFDPGRAAEGTNIVRSPDWLHFCPAQLRVATESCPVYASGAFRYSTAVLGAVAVVAALEVPPLPTTSTTSTEPATTSTEPATTTTEPVTTTTEPATTTTEPATTASTVPATTTTDPGSVTSP